MYVATFFQWRREAASSFDVDLVIFTTKRSRRKYRREENGGGSFKGDSSVFVYTKERKWGHNKITSLEKYYPKRATSPKEKNKYNKFIYFSHIHTYCIYNVSNFISAGADLIQWTVTVSYILFAEISSGSFRTSVANSIWYVTSPAGHLNWLNFQLNSRILRYIFLLYKDSVSFERKTHFSIFV